MAQWYAIKNDSLLVLVLIVNGTEAEAEVVRIDDTHWYTNKDMMDSHGVAS